MTNLASQRRSHKLPAAACSTALLDYLNINDNAHERPIHSRREPANWQVWPNATMYLLVASWNAPNAKDLLLR